jgi:hypothetical protein
MMNDETEQFERRLSRQPLRQVPGEWRAEILAAARGTQPVPRASRLTPRAWLVTINQQLATLLWPHPKAWAGLAAVWILILAVNFSTREAVPKLAAKSAPPSPEVMVELKQQQRLVAELVSTYEAPDTDRRKTFLPRPSSQRAEILIT